MLSLKDGRFLVNVARRAIESHVGEGKIPRPKDVSDNLKEPRGVFVTLSKHGDLRGCIGRPLPTMPLIDAVVDSAVSSATMDPRFPPVTPKELQEIVVEVSVLTKPEAVKVKHPREYPKCITVGKHGLIMECEGFSGLLLPQVPVEWEWNEEEFLSHACMKAGLQPDEWLKGKVCVSRFCAQVFKEKEPRGEVEELKPPEEKNK
ncbi:MAG: TIGR00296 family protein [Candidatus Hadarchaeota archaeon]